MEKIGYDLELTRRVTELLEDGVLWQVIKLVEDDLRSEIFTTAPDDSSSRERIYHEMHALNRVNLKLTTLVDSLKFYERRDE